MRIISGVYRSRAVKTGKDMRIRPTSDKVKGALFNMLGPLEGNQVLDLYSGCGNLGLEALSRGAERVVFVDRHPESLALIRENLSSLGLEPRDSRIRIIGQDVLQACRSLHLEGQSFDVILADPPYETGALRHVLEMMKEYPLFKAGALLAVEHHSKDTEMMPDFQPEMVRQRQYGDTSLSLFKSL